VDNSTYGRFRVTSVISGTSPKSSIWNDHVEDFLFERLTKPSERVTVAGPPQCQDRPWWWGKSLTNG
jgi:hypothetical protein